MNNWNTSISTLTMDKRVFSKEKESTATLGLAGMVLRTVIATKKTLVCEWTHTAV